MKKIKDERLILKNLKNIRIAFFVQTIGIISILVYKAITINLDSVLGSPLWYVLMISCLVTVYLNMNIAIDNEEQDKQTKNQVPLYKKILIILVIGIVISVLIIFTSDTTIMSAAIIGAVFFLCFTATYTYTHHLKKKRLEDDDDEL